MLRLSACSTSRTGCSSRRGRNSVVTVRAHLPQQTSTKQTVNKPRAPEAPLVFQALPTFEDCFPASQKLYTEVQHNGSTLKARLGRQRPLRSRLSADQS